MILIALHYGIILFEMLIRLVIVGENVIAIIRPLYPKMIIGDICQTAFTVSTFNGSLCQSDRGRYAITLHLKHGILCIFVEIFLS